MSHAADDLLRAIARSMADGQRVLMVGSSFATLELLAAADVRELVLVTEDADPSAPEGVTGTGAPLRLRPDWRERPRSKDIILDPDGIAPPDEVERLLKKRGVYLTREANAVTEALPHARTVTAGRAEALLIDPSGGQSTELPALALAEPTDDGPHVQVAGKTDVTLPALACLTTVPETIDPAELAAAEETIARLEAAQADATAQVEALKAELEAARAALAAAEEAEARQTVALTVEQAERAAAQAELEVEKAARGAAEVEHNAAREALIAEHDETRATLASREAELAELEQDYDAVRSELAERRVEDRRFESLRARFDEARASMTAEVTELRDRLRAVDAQTVDLETVVAERDRARQEAGRLLARLADALERLAPAQLLPAVPVSGDSEAQQATLDAWLEDAERAIERAELADTADREALSDARDRIDALDAEVRAQRAAAEIATAEASPGRQPTAEAMAEASELLARIDHLEAALAAEQALRASERAGRDRARAAAAAAETLCVDLQRDLLAARQATAEARLAEADADDARTRLRAEVERRAARSAALADMVEAHRRMQGLLTEAVGAAEDRADIAEAGRRLAESSLSLLRSEFERMRGDAGTGR